MSSLSAPIIVLPGANGAAPDLAMFSTDAAVRARFRTIDYPQWHQYLSADFTAEVFIAELAAQIASIAQQNPIHIVGISIGGHFGYAAALRLQASGHEIASFCALDTFMIASSAARAGWQKRALERVVTLFRKRHVDDIADFFRSRFWRALLRLSGDRLPGLLRAFSAHKALPVIMRDPKLAEEVRMRLLLRLVGSWVASLDVAPAPLNVPSVLFRTAESAGDDATWRRRCPDMTILQIPGTHQTIFDQENVRPLREVFVAGTHNWSFGRDR